MIKIESYHRDDHCFYYYSWSNNVVIAFGTLSSFLAYLYITPYQIQHFKRMFELRVFGVPFLSNEICDDRRLKICGLMRMLVIALD